MGRAQYTLLLKTDCSREQLEAAWYEWNNMKGRRADYERANLMQAGTDTWGCQWATYREIQRGLYGPTDVHEDFLKKWLEQGLKEAREDSNWVMFEAVEELLEEIPRARKNPVDILFGVDSE